MTDTDLNDTVDTPQNEPLAGDQLSLIDDGPVSRDSVDGAEAAVDSTGTEQATGHPDEPEPQEPVEPATVRAEESPVAEPVDEAPTPAPVEEAPASDPVDEAPVPQPVDEVPDVETVDEQSAPEPDSETAAEEPVDETPSSDSSAEGAESGVLTTEGPILPPAEEPSLPALQTASSPVASRTWTQVPFVVLGAAWLGLVGAVTYLLWTSSPESLLASPYYGVLILGGASLTLLGFLTGLVVWLLARSRAAQDERGAVARSIWFRAMAWTAGGVAFWWIALLVLDLHRQSVR